MLGKVDWPSEVPKSTAERLASTTTHAAAPSSHRRPLTIIAVVVIVVGVAIVAALRKSYRAFDAADHTAHHAADNRANRTGIAIADCGAMLAAVNDALRPRRGLYRENGYSRQKADGVMINFVFMDKSFFTEITGLFPMPDRCDPFLFDF